MILRINFYQILLWILPIASAFTLGLIFYKLIPAYLVFIAFVPFLIFLDKARNWKRVLVAGFFAGAVYLLMYLYTVTLFKWFGFISSETTFMYGAYTLASFAGGIVWALFSLVVYFVWRRHWSMMFLVAAAWVLIEFARRWVSFGFTWGFLGYLTGDLTKIRELANISGLLGIAFFILFVNVWVFLVFSNIFKADGFKNILKLTLLFVVSSVLIFSISTKAQLDLNFKAPIKVAALQVDKVVHKKSFSEEPYFSLLLQAKAHNPDLIVMPESVLRDLDSSEGRSEVEIMEQSLLEVMGDFPGLVAFGAPRNEGEDLYNSFYLWKDGSIIDVYDKYYLVPFAEYKPVFFSRFSPESKTMDTRGAKEQSFKSESLAFGALICQESIYPEATRRPVLAGAEILLNGVNDGFVSDSKLLNRFAPAKNHWLYTIEHTTSRFRAIESGRYLVRATKVGIASIINPFGKEVVRADSGGRAVLVADISRVEGLTPYVRFGDTPILIISLLLVGWGFYNRRFFKRNKN